MMADQVDQAISEKGRQGSFSGWSGAPDETGLGGGGPRARRAAALRPTSSTAKSVLLVACTLILFLLWQRALSWDQTSELYLHDAAITHEPGPVGRPELLTGFVPPKRSSDGLTTDVEWDKYSLFVKGQRLVIWSGEVHPWRLPVPALWIDLLEKIKAAGLNTVSIYVNWALVNPSRGVTDWTGYRDLQRFCEICREVGLWLILRPGPHIQAEASAGGIAYFALNIEGELRTNASDYREAWSQYVSEVSEIARRNQITEGGPIIAVQVENEYYQRLDKDGQRRGDKGKWQWTKVAHVEELKKAFREAGIVVPLTHNDVGFKSNYLKGPGAPDLWGFDAYPQGFDCSTPDDWHQLSGSWGDDHLKLDPDRPSFSPEFQAGAFDGIGGAGYERCAQLTNAAFERVAYMGHLWAANVKMTSLYMLYGGTNWGHLATPSVYTSYDYGAPISEGRQIGSKMAELRLQGLFLRTAQDFAMTNIVAVKPSATNQDVITTELRNPSSGAGFYIVRHANSSSAASERFQLTIAHSKGETTFRNMTLAGRDVRMGYADYAFGHTHVLFTTGTIAFSTTIDGVDILLLHGRKGMHDLYFSLLGVDSLQTTGDLRIEGLASVALLAPSPHVETAPVFRAALSTGRSGTTAIELPGRRLVLLADSESAATYFQLTISGGKGPFASYYGVGTNETVMVAGPHLTRTAHYVDDVTLALRGDLDEAVMLWVYAPRRITKVSWNGQLVRVARNAFGGLEGPLEFVPPAVKLPRLERWKYRDSLPEANPSFDDASFVAAAQTTSTNPYWNSTKTDGVVLHAGTYGFHNGHVLWRGRFNATSKAPAEAVHLVIASGWGGAASAWLNGRYLGSNQSLSSDDDELRLDLALPTEALRQDEEQVLTVLQDNMGYLNDDGNNAFKKPRGIMACRLSNGAFTSWRVQGNLGGEDAPDTVRGGNNEGGLFAERAGWHLPGFDDSTWIVRSPSDGLKSPSVAFFRTMFELTIPHDLDVPISLDFSVDRGAYRAQVYINGWQIGKLHSKAGPQYSFPLHPGLLDTDGSNVLAIALWSVGVEPADLRIESIELRAGAIVQGGLGYIETNNPPYEPR